MPKKFLDLPQQDQSEIIITTSSKLGISPIVIEKDLWVCWALKVLFEMPDPLPMAFKGGTSLSKVFDVIQRFSEDIDISLDCRSLDKNLTKTVMELSQNQRKRQDKLAEQYVKEVISPYFEKKIEEESWGTHLQLRVEGEKMYLRYPALSEKSDSGYLKEEVLLEFGGKNTTTPPEIHTVSPLLKKEIPELEFPIANVTVLSPKRTFWEKAVLIHVKCSESPKEPACLLQENGAFLLCANGSRIPLDKPINHISRHWYDLAKLLDHDIGQDAFNDHEVLKTVITHQKNQNPSSRKKYNDCLQGKFKLIPDAQLMTEIKSDFHAMLASGMFYDVQPSFDVVMDRIHTFEQEINRRLVNAPLN